METPSPLEAIFFAALERGPTERTAYLDEACGGDPDLRRRVEKMLAAQSQARSFLEQPAAASVTVDLPAAAERPGTVIGPYKLLERIGEGGFGVVFLAEQSEPVRRKVALKLLKAGMDTRQVVARFEAERQALALMDHPNIAKVFDGGQTPAGRPYFVMELVKGVPITKFCDDHRLTPRQRLELFVPVCHAVQHAHQKGVIHRDLKPSNVLVALYDDKPVPKVIDFGVAKAAGQPLTEQTLHTGYGAVVGTVEYMSPEQATFNQLDVDTRSDVYSLGVVLYELLVGSPPFSKKELEAAGMLEMLRVIREQEPSRPSTKLSAGDGLPTLAANRGTEPARLTKLVRGELDWIVMKALEKDRSRRYETANGFAIDIQRYLADEPVLACPPSAGYRLRKFARRNRAPLAVSGLVVFFVILLGMGAGWAIRDRAAREHRLTAQVEQILADIDRLEQEQKWREALATIGRAEAVLAGGAGDPIRQRVADARNDLEFVAELERVRQHAAATGGWFKDAGAARDYARVFREYGMDLENLPAEAAVARLGRKPALAAPIAAALDDWVETRRVLGEGEASWKPLVAVARGLDPDPLRDRLRATWGQPVTPERQAELLRLAGSVDVRTQRPATLKVLARTLARANLPDAALRVRRDAQFAYPADFWSNFDLGIQLLRTDYRAAARYFSVAASLRPDSAAAYNGLGLVLKDQGKLDEAIACLKKAIELDPEYEDSYCNLTVVLAAKGDLDGAVTYARKAVELGPKSAWPHIALGIARRHRGDLDGAVASCRKAIELDPNEAGAHTSLGQALCNQGKVDDAIAEYRKALALDPDDAALIRTNLGKALNKQGKADEAAAEYRKAIGANPQYGLAHSNLGSVFHEQGKPDEAMVEYRMAIECDPCCAPAHHNIGIILGDRRRPGEAVACFKKAVELDPNSALFQSSLGGCYAQLGRWNDAIRAYDRSLELDLTNHLGWYMAATLYAAAGDRDCYRRTCAKMLERFGGTDNPRTAERTTKACLLLPDALSPADAERVQKLADRAVPGDDFFAMARGLAEYRAGRHAEAVTWIERSHPYPNANHWDAIKFAVLAMAQHRLDHTDEAEAALASAKAILAKMPDPAKGRPFGAGDWWDWLHAQLLCREAEELLEEDQGSRKQPN